MLKLLTTLVLLLTTVASEAQIQIKGYNHVGLSVKDMYASAAFYRDIIGLEIIEVPENLRPIRVWFKIGEGQELHLLAGRKDTVTNNDRNAAHFSLTIENADPVEAFLKSKNIPYHRQQRFDKAWQIYVTDPDGYVIELNEPKRKN
jgi:lactoylglutathione lyase